MRPIEQSLSLLKARQFRYDIAMQLLKMPQEAKDYATQIHEGQMYGEQPYMTHVEDVASGFDDPHLQRIAYLHDTVEDSETGIGEIHERFGEDVGHAVDALTRRQGEQYFDYINRVKEHPEATQVKLADLHSNLKNNPNESLARRYQKAIGILTNKSEPMDLAWRLLKMPKPDFPYYGNPEEFSISHNFIPWESEGEEHLPEDDNMKIIEVAAHQGLEEQGMEPMKYGHASFYVENDKLIPRTAYTHPSFRRGGIATDLYNHAEQVTGLPVVDESPMQSEDALRFWENRSDM